MKPWAALEVYEDMSDQQKSPDLRDANLAAEERPVPSQAEGDLTTVEQDLEEKEQDKARKASFNAQK